MPQAGTVKVRGLREAMAALNKIERGSHKVVMGGILTAVEPVKQSWAGKLSRYQGASTGTLTPAMTTRSVFVRQKAKKVTGRRGDFGGLQMRLGLEALWEEADNTTKAVEDALDRLTRGAGF